MSRKVRVTRPSRKSRATISLVCPKCRAPLDAGRAQLTCRACDLRAPIRHGIPRFVGELEPGQAQVQRAFDFEHRQARDSTHLELNDARVEDWLGYTGLPRAYFRGKRVLDAGCGTGRWTYAMARLGAQVTAVDITAAGAEATARLARSFPSVQVIQADVTRLPFAPATFDLVASWGVLHHTPSTFGSLARLAPLVKPGGHLYVMVYEHHNPVKFWLTDRVRQLFRFVGPRRAYRLCRHLVIRRPWLHERLAHWLICSGAPREASEREISTLQLGLFDAYAPRYNHLHTRAEVLGWFDQLGFTEITPTQPVRFASGSLRFFNGESGGAVHVRGRRRA